MSSGLSEKERDFILRALIAQQEEDDRSNCGLSIAAETVSYEDAGLEESPNQPTCGSGYFDARNECPLGGVPEYVAWFSDGEDSRYETN